MKYLSKLFLILITALILQIIDLLPSEERDNLTRDTSNLVIPNLVEEARMFEWAGIGFGEEIMYRMQKAIRKLAILSGASSLRFWGKIYGQ